MKVSLNHSFGRALAIMHLVLLAQEYVEGESEWYIEAYQNCREQGITIHLSSLPGMESTLYVSEHRVSDEIVVYEGRYSNQAISESAYANYRMFANESLAAEYIIERMKFFSQKVAVE